MVDYRCLDVRREDGSWLCPSCGFAGYFTGDSFSILGPLIATGICPCCLYERGFDDVSAASGTPHGEPIDALQEYARAWRDGGAQWRGVGSAKPKDWDVVGQLADWERLVLPELSRVVDMISAGDRP